MIVMYGLLLNCLEHGTIRKHYNLETMINTKWALYKNISILHGNKFKINWFT